MSHNEPLTADLEARAQELAARIRARADEDILALARLLVSKKHPRQESNLIPDLRRVVCDPPHPEDRNIPVRIRTGIETFEESCVAPIHRQDIQEPTAGFAPA